MNAPEDPNLTAWALSELPSEDRAAFESRMKSDGTLFAQAQQTQSFCRFIQSHLKDDTAALTESQRTRIMSYVQWKPMQRLDDAGEYVPPKPVKLPWYQKSSFVIPFSAAAAVALGLWPYWSERLFPKKSVADNIPFYPTATTQTKPDTKHAVLAPGESSGNVAAASAPQWHTESQGSRAPGNKGVRQTVNVDLGRSLRAPVPSDGTTLPSQEDAGDPRNAANTARVMQASLGDAPRRYSNPSSPRAVPTPAGSTFFFTVSGNATVTLTGTNPYTGGTTITVDATPSPDGPAPAPTMASYADAPPIPAGIMPAGTISSPPGSLNELDDSPAAHLMHRSNGVLSANGFSSGLTSESSGSGTQAITPAAGPPATASVPASTANGTPTRRRIDLDAMAGGQNGGSPLPSSASPGTAAVLTDAAAQPVSTLAMNVSTTSYARARQLIAGGQLPQRDAVRIEELVNAFPYNYEFAQAATEPFGAMASVAEAPWNPTNRLVRIAVRARDSVLKRMFAGGAGSTLDDLKLQVEFNPAIVRAYRLIGYDQNLTPAAPGMIGAKNAGGLASGRTFTALYEIVTTGGAQAADRVMTVKLRGARSSSVHDMFLELSVTDEGQSLQHSDGDFKLAAAAASFGLLLRDSSYKGTLTWPQVRQLAIEAKGDDPGGNRAEFVDLIDSAAKLSGSAPR